MAACADNSKVLELKGLAALWHYLSQVFIAIPDVGIVSLTRDMLTVLESMYEETGSATLATAVEKLRIFTDEASNMSEDALRDKLNTDYTYLFLMGRDCVPNSESVWLSPSGLEMQEPREQVVIVYEMLGFCKPVQYKEPEDQIGVELLFLASMALSAANAAEEGRDTAGYEKSMAEFIDEHPGKWIMHFGKGVGKRQKAMKDEPLLDIYHGAALLAMFMINELN